MTLSSGSVVGVGGFFIDLQLTAADLNSIVFSPELATDINSTFITVEPSAITDVSGNELVAIPSTQAQQALFYTPVLIEGVAEVVAFGLDLNQGTLTLTFSAFVDAVSLNSSRLTIQSSPLADPM